MKNVTYINAGAGSGKTYTLTQQLVKLIKEGKAKPEQVILTTFTIKAASEFKEKAKAELYKEGLFDEAIRLDQALIGTVHSVCQRMISKYWFYLGLAPDMGVMAEEDATYYMSQSLADTPTDAELRQLHRFAWNFDIRVKNGFWYSYQIDNDFWQEDLKRIIAYTTNYEIADYQKSEEESVAFISQFVDKSVVLDYSAEELKAILDEHFDFLNNQRASDTRDKRIATLKELYRGYQNPSLAWYAKAGELMSAIKSCGPLAARFREQASHVWVSKRVFDEQKSYIHLIFQLVQRWREHYARFKQEKNLLDFNDMEKYMHQLMSVSAVADEISQSFRYLFVDEFQDSSPIQVKIFDALSNLMQASYWVGDYKQAIYGFRGSDIKLVKAVVDKISQKQAGCDTRTLDTSWRSLPDIVDIDNHVFASTFQGVLPRENVVLKKHRENELHIQSLRYFRSTDELGVPAHIAKLIAQGAQPCDIGVLARTNSELSEVADVLKRDYGIASSRENVEVIFSDTYILVESLLRILNSDKDLLARAQVAWLVEKDFSVKQIIERKILNDEAVRAGEGARYEDYLSDVPIIVHLLRIKSRLKQQSIASMVESMIIELNLYDVVKSLYRDGDSGGSSLQVIINTAKTYEEHSVQMNLPATIDGFINYIKDVDPVGSGDSMGVQLHTYHSCKGLEQKYVILMSLGNDEGNEKNLVRNEIYGIHALHISEPSVDDIYPEVFVRVVPWIYGAKKNVPGTIGEKILESDLLKVVKQDTLAEANRLLYVGMTRPRDVMLLEIKSTRSKHPLKWFEAEGCAQITSQPEQGAWDIFDCGLQFADFTITPEQRDDMADGGLLSLSTHYRLCSGEVELLDLPHFYVSPSEIRYKSQIASVCDFENRIPFASQPSSMAVVGDCIHQIFAYIEEISGKVLKQKVQMTISQYGLEDVFANVEAIQDSWKRLVDFLTNQHGAPEATCHELPFRLERNGQTLVGSIDLVWKTNQGSVVVDYKTCPMGVKVIEDETSEHYAGWYAGQLDAYTDALEASGNHIIKRYIYYPVSGIIAEI